MEVAAERGRIDAGRLTICIMRACWAWVVYAAWGCFVNSILFISLSCWSPVFQGLSLTIVLARWLPFENANEKQKPWGPKNATREKLEMCWLIVIRVDTDIR